MRERLTTDDVRNIEEGRRLVVKLHDDCYWMQGEGRVATVTEYDDGSTTVLMHGSRGHECRLKIPADGRKRKTFTGAASGARNLPVKEVIDVTR